MESTPVRIVSSTLSKNSAPSSSGGAVFFRGLQDSTLLVGGWRCVSSGYVPCQPCFFIVHTQGMRSLSRFLIHSVFRLQIDSSVLFENVANSGGGIFVTGSLAALTVESGTVLDSNSAASGGAVFLEGASMASFLGPLTLKGNIATGDTETQVVGTRGRGGAVYLRNGNALVQGVVFDGNKAAEGGGLFVEVGVCSFSRPPDEVLCLLGRFHFTFFGFLSGGISLFLCGACRWLAHLVTIYTCPVRPVFFLRRSWDHNLWEHIFEQCCSAGWGCPYVG